MTRRGWKSTCPASGGRGDSGQGPAWLGTGPIFPVATAPAAKQKRRASVVALGKKPRSVNYFGPITAHNEGPGVPRNTSSCCGISPSLVQPDGAARDEKARAGSEGREGRRFCFYLICPERERERGAMGDEAVASAAISWDPPGYSSSILTESCTVIDAWSSRRGCLSSSSFFSFLSSSFVSSSFFSLSSSSSSCPSCHSFSAASSYRCWALYFLNNKAPQSGPCDIVHSISWYSADHDRTFNIAFQRARKTSLRYRRSSRCSICTKTSRY